MISKIWEKYLVLGGLLLLVGAVVAFAHWPALSAQALSFDDHGYLVRNELVRNPSWASARRFLTEVSRPSTVGGYYQPLSMISLMLDYAVAGCTENLRPFHRTSLLLHVFNTGLIVVLLYLLFGNPWAAALMGLLFGCHPLTVEPIPWIGERKTLLAAFFALWCFVFYARYGQRASYWLYGACLLLYVLALMSKPTTTPLPLLLLLLDYWPLGRLNGRAVIEKIPFFVIAGVSAFITVVSQSSASIIKPGQFPLIEIPLTFCHNIIFYLYKIVWPVNLSSHYPFPYPMSLAHPMVLAGFTGSLILLAVLLISWHWTRALLVSFLFFFVGILPTMQILRFSPVIASDKFVYLPSVGLLLPLACLLSSLWGRFMPGNRRLLRRLVILSVVSLLVVAETVATRRYLRCWQDSGTLYRRMVRLAPRAAVPHFALGCFLLEKEETDAAVKEFQQAVQIDPNYIMAHSNLGKAFELKGQTDRAIVHYARALKLRPCAWGYFNLANALVQAQRVEEAIKLYERALEYSPSYAEVHNNLAAALNLQGRTDEAIIHLVKALHCKPGYPEARGNLVAILTQLGRLDQAISELRQSLQRHALDADTHYQLATLLVRKSQLAQAVGEFREALRINPAHAAARRELEAALVRQAESKGVSED